MGDIWAVDVYDLDHDDQPIAFSPRTAVADISSCNIYCRSVECAAGTALSTLAVTTDLLCDSSPCAQEQCCVPVATTLPPCSACAFKDRPYTILFKLQPGGVGLLSNVQGGKASVLGDAVAAASNGPFAIKCFNSKSVGHADGTTPQTMLELGAVYTASDLHGTGLTCTISWGLSATDQKLQTVDIHTSCSHPLVVGDRYGALEIFGYTSDTGIVTNGLSGCSNKDPCISSGAPPSSVIPPEVVSSGCTICGSKRSRAKNSKARLAELVLSVTGGGPSTLLANPQDGKASVAGDTVSSAADGPFSVHCFNSKQGANDLSGYKQVAFGISFSVHGISGITTVRCHLKWATGAQTVEIHTSCSKPFAVGDQFGALVIVSATLSSGTTITGDCSAAAASKNNLRVPDLDERCKGGKSNSKGNGGGEFGRKEQTNSKSRKEQKRKKEEKAPKDTSFLKIKSAQDAAVKASRHSRAGGANYGKTLAVVSISAAAAVAFAGAFFVASRWRLRWRVLGGGETIRLLPMPLPMLS